VFTSQMIEGGTVKPKEIAKTFGVPMITVKRYLKLYREHGSKGFYETKPRHSSASVLKEEVPEQAQRLLDEGRSAPEVAAEVDVLTNSLHKAVRAGRLRGAQKKCVRGNEVINKSARSQNAGAGAAAGRRCASSLVHDRVRPGRVHPDFFEQMRKQRIAILAYDKSPQDDWPSEDFATHSVALASGETVTMKLAERDTQLTNQLELREIRKLNDSWHQTSMLTTTFRPR
jgi:hypothetical protein